MLNLLSRTAINDAKANIALAEHLLSAGNRREADVAIREAESHYRKARTAVEKPDQIADKLADLRAELERVKSILSRTALKCSLISDIRRD